MKKSELKAIIREALTELNEIKIDPTPYVRSHAKDPKGTGNWFFSKTNKSIDFNSDKEGIDYIRVNGALNAAAKEAAQKLKTNVVYVMP